jgi:hypothetical protein
MTPTRGLWAHRPRRTSPDRPLLLSGLDVAFFFAAAAVTGDVSFKVIIRILLWKLNITTIIKIHTQIAQVSHREEKLCQGKKLYSVESGLLFNLKLWSIAVSEYALSLISTLNFVQRKRRTNMSRNILLSTWTDAVVGTQGTDGGYPNDLRSSSWALLTTCRERKTPGLVVSIWRRLYRLRNLQEHAGYQT